MRRSRPIFTTFQCNYSHYESTEKTEKIEDIFLADQGLIRAFQFEMMKKINLDSFLYITRIYRIPE